MARNVTGSDRLSAPLFENCSRYAERCCLAIAAGLATIQKCKTQPTTAGYETGVQIKYGATSHTHVTQPTWDNPNPVCFSPAAECSVSSQSRQCRACPHRMRPSRIRLGAVPSFLKFRFFFSPGHFHWPFCSLFLAFQVSEFDGKRNGRPGIYRIVSRQSCNLPPNLQGWTLFSPLRPAGSWITSILHDATPDAQQSRQPESVQRGTRGSATC
jgi:hypothetical protein